MKEILTTITSHIEEVAKRAGIENPKASFEYPEIISQGDLATNIAMIHAKALKQNPKVLAEKIVDEFKKDMPAAVTDISAAGPGFINIKLRASVFTKGILLIDETFGKNELEKGKKIMVEYTDPNPFKEFHIGHLMSNAIGESIARLAEFSGAEVKRANWQGDVGPHVAKALWGAMKLGVTAESGSGPAQWGKAYAFGAQSYDADETAKAEIQEINKKIYSQNDPAINALYEKGRSESLASFENIYKRLGTKFDNYFFEGKEGRNGEAIVKEFQEKGIFEVSEGAVIFPGEKHGLHTRVFLTSQGLPTYEAKELGLNLEKFRIYPDLAQSIIITANEQNAYFKVLLKVFSLINPPIAEKTRHISHGMMRLTTGKMGSRKGNVITAEDFISEAKSLVDEKIKDRDFDAEEKEKLSEEVAIAAIKYQVLRQAIGGDIVYDPEKSVSFEGDSGPYLQYSCVRANTVLLRAKEEKIPEAVPVETHPQEASLLEKMLLRFPEVVVHAHTENAPHRVTTYLTELAAAFNSYYANNKIIDKENPLSPYRVKLTQAFVIVMTNGLTLLGIKIPKRM